MGCCASSPHSARRYADPADMDEMIVPEDSLPLRTFGKFRTGSVVIPDDIDGLPSAQVDSHLSSDPHELLYDAEVDQGRAFRCLRPWLIVWATPCGLAYLFTNGLGRFVKSMTCDESCCWVRKEYSSRSHYRIYPNRIEVNYPSVRVPFGFLGCGSWNSDAPLTHVFDRGAFGFRPVRCGVINLLCCAWPVYGGVVARQRCPCNGPVWIGGWWCDEWLCDTMFCSYRYYGLADADEVAAASCVALQAYYENRRLTRSDMDRCVRYWRDNVSEMGDAGGRRRRDVMCEPFCVPWYDCRHAQACCHPRRTIPYKKDDARNSSELSEAYERYERLRLKQIARYRNFHGPVRNSTLCRTLGCRRLFGRRGLVFCTEGCCRDGGSGGVRRRGGDPAPPIAHRDCDDDNDAARILTAVLGGPPPNVEYRRWERDEGTGEYEVVTYRGELLPGRKREKGGGEEEESGPPAPSAVYRSLAARTTAPADGGTETAAYA